MNIIDEIKKRINIVDLATEFGLQPTKKDFVYSIYKEEKNRSLKLYPETNSFYCFATGRGGDVINFYKDYYKIDIKDAINVACKAQKGWARLPWDQRASVFLKAADLLSTKYRARINAATVLAQSKTCHQAEIDAACELADFLRFNVYFAQKIYEQQPIHSPFGQWNRSEARGLEGFVFAIAPFNFTAISVNLAAAPALMGCSVLWKPAPSA